MTKDPITARLRTWFMRRTISSAVRRLGESTAAIGTDIGVVRSENQDRVATLKMQISPDRSFFAVVLCDGMGGMAEGATCASIAAAHFLSACVRYRDSSVTDRLTRAAHEANHAVSAVFAGRGGATLSALVIDDKFGTAGVNIGDSRIYFYSAGQLTQATTDDTLAGRIPNAGDSRRNELLQFIGIGDGLEPHILPIPGEVEFALLTSDGAHSTEKSVIQQIVQNAKEPALAIRRITEVSKWCGGHDNASAALVAPSGILSSSVDDLGILQVWDPFGDLQIVFTEPQNNGAMTRYKQERDNVKYVREPIREEHPSAPAEISEPPPKAEKKTRIRKKKRPPTKDSQGNDTEIPGRPQLKIDFVEGGGNGDA